MADEKTKKKRGPRRDYKREHEKLALYCDVMIEVLTKSNTVESVRDSQNASIAAYADIREKLDNGKKREAVNG